MSRSSTIKAFPWKARITSLNYMPGTRAMASNPSAPQCRSRPTAIFTVLRLSCHSCRVVLQRGSRSWHGKHKAGRLLTRLPWRVPGQEYPAVLFLPQTGSPSRPEACPEARLGGLQYPGSPLVVRQPQAQTILAGERSTLSVIASSGVQMAYQWYQQPSARPDGLILSATNATYTTPLLSTNATYWVSISNSAGSVLSDKATVTVVATAPRLALQLPTGLPMLTLEGPVGTTYRIEYSTNLSATNWTSLVELSLSATPFTFSDSGWTNSPARFYRAVLRIGFTQ